MRPLIRWPLHPAPIEGEALSSWLRRIAKCYDMYLDDFLEFGLGEITPTSDDLDLDPPPRLLAALTERTNVEADRLQAMTIAGWIPWLNDTWESEPDTFNTYVHQFSVMLKPATDNQQPTKPWRAWFPEQQLYLACPHCLDDPSRRAMMLMWQLPLMRTCPQHRCWLRRCIGSADYPFWKGDPVPPTAPSEAVLAMDRYTVQGLRTGWVQLPQRRVHAAVWLRLLRTVINEVGSPLRYWTSRVPDLRHIWETAGHRVRAGQSMWKPYETSTWPVQAQTLEATAVAISLLHSGTVTGRGTSATLFTPEPLLLDYDSSPPPRIPPPRGSWASVVEAIDAVVAEAKRDPAGAQQLYNFLLTGCKTSKAAVGVLDNFVELGIPIEHLSHERVRTLGVM